MGNRMCLKCSKPFESEHRFNRLCKLCKESNARMGCHKDIVIHKSDKAIVASEVRYKRRKRMEFDDGKA